MTEALLIDRFLPEYDLAIAYSAVFRAPPRRSFETVVESDLFTIPGFRLLIGGRRLPQRLADAVRRQRDHAGVPAAQPTFRLKDMPAIGWIPLGERPGSELAFGQVGKPWKGLASFPEEPVKRETFAGFDQPGFAKIVGSTSVVAYGERASIVTIETRVVCTDEDSRRRFRRYWLLIVPFSRYLRGTGLPALARKAQRRD